MTAIVPLAGVAQPSQALVSALAAVPAAWSDRRAVPALPPALRTEALHRLAACEAVLAERAEPEAIRRWLARIVTLIGHPRTADAIEAKIAAVSVALEDLPRRCFTPASAQAVAVAAGRWFPPLAELRAVAAAKAGAVRLEAAKLRALLARPARAEAEEEPEEWSPAATLARVARLESAEPGAITGIAAGVLLATIRRRCPELLAEAEPRLAALSPRPIGGQAVRVLRGAGPEEQPEG